MYLLLTGTRRTNWSFCTVEFIKRPKENARIWNENYIYRLTCQMSSYFLGDDDVDALARAELLCTVIAWTSLMANYGLGTFARIDAVKNARQDHSAPPVATTLRAYMKKFKSEAGFEA